MAIIIVGKRHNIRFYLMKKEDIDRSLNPQNGTVVEERNSNQFRHRTVLIGFEPNLIFK